MFEKRYTLLRTQKRRVYEILRESGLEPAEFSWSREVIAGSLSVSMLRHRGGQHYFQFSSYEMNSWCVACPGTYRSMDYSYPKSWAEQERLFGVWAQCLRKELDTPDVWAEMAKYRLALDGELSEDLANEPIPAVEADAIGRGLVRLAEKVAQDLELDGDQEALVRARLEYLADAARWKRSRDWMYMTLGVWVSLAAALALSQEQGGRFWELIRGELGSFVRLVPGVAPPHPKRSILGIRSAARAEDKPAPRGRA